MTHPFALNLSDLETVDLEFEEHLNSENDAQIEGGTLIAGCFTQVGYEGGGYECPPPYPYPRYQPPVQPPCYYPDPYPIIPQPPLSTTMAYGEEGGGCLDYCM